MIERLIECPYEISVENRERAIAACVAAMPDGAIVKALPLPKPPYAKTVTLPNGVRILEVFVPFPLDGEPRMMGRASLLFAMESA